ncbi:MAG: hypothetical protein HDT40_02195 [Lachnospiraceae bacterium]|nr:hypothetical protein [Lachnospiraceae bacterium]
MKYFLHDSERKNTICHEFQKGKFDGHTFWKSDSISLSDDLVVTLGIDKLFRDVIPNYNSYDDFEIDNELWNNIMLKAQEIGGEVLTCISEADEWAKNTFLEYDVFTIMQP